MSDFQYNEELSATMGLVKSQSAELDRLRAEVARLKDEQRLDRQHIANLTELNKEALETNARHMAEHRDLTQQLAAANGRVEKLENALSLAVGMIGHPDNIALLQAALTALPQQVKSEDARDDALQEKTK